MYIFGTCMCRNDTSCGSAKEPWTVAAPPQLGLKAKMIVNPMGKHSSDLNDPNLCSPDIKQEVMDYETPVSKNIFLLKYFPIKIFSYFPISRKNRVRW